MLLKSGYARTMFIGIVSSLSAMVLYFVISAFWGEPLTKPQQTLIIGVIVFLIVIPLATFMYYKGKDQLKNVFREEISEEVRPSIEKEFRDFFEAQTGIEKIFDNFPACEDEILAQLKNSKNVRIFLQIGKTVLSGTTNFYDYLAEATMESMNSIKILHSSLESPYLSEKVAHERKSDYVDWQADLDYAAKKVGALYMKSQLNTLARQHKEGYFWRLFLFDNYAYIQPYLYKRDNSERAPVIKISRFLSSSPDRKENDKSLYIVFSNFFDLKWEEYRPSFNQLIDLIPERSFSSVAAVIKYTQFFLFAIPRRYIQKDAKEIPFHGIGGKLGPGEDWASALMREAREETGAKLKIGNSAKTRYVTTGAELEAIILSDKPKPYCVYRRTREVDPNFSHQEVMYLVGYEADVQVDSIDDLKPRAELGAIVCLTGDMLRRTLHERVTYSDIAKAEDGSRIIFGESVSFDLSRRAVPSGLATIVASEQHPGFYKRL